MSNTNATAIVIYDYPKLIWQHDDIVRLKVSQLKNQSEVMWLNPVDEHLAKGWKKGQGPTTACLGE
jgi:hypothetical protein